VVHVPLLRGTTGKPEKIYVTTDSFMFRYYFNPFNADHSVEEIFVFVYLHNNVKYPLVKSRNNFNFWETVCLFHDLVKHQVHARRADICKRDISFILCKWLRKIDKKKQLYKWYCYKYCSRNLFLCISVTVL